MLKILSHIKKSTMTTSFIFNASLGNYFSSYKYMESNLPIVIYGTTFCGPCNKAKKYL